MSADITIYFPPDGPDDIGSNFKRIFEGLAASSAVLDRIDRKLDTIARDRRNELGGTRDVFRQRLSIESGNIRELIADLDRRVRAIEERQPAP